MSCDFYKAFEDKFRGSPALIKSRLAVYLPFIKPLFELNPQAKALDLGCGRGEWLELLLELGIKGQGIDLDDSMLASCRQRGLEVKKEDALTFLKAEPPETQLAISGFHLAEHLPFSYLQELIKEALRVLQPGGILILETPNVENLKVAALEFWFDPSHNHPLPAPLLSFLAEWTGFYRSKILRLQDTAFLLNNEPSLMSVYAGASPDCSLVAQKKAEQPILDLTQAAFNRDYGISQETVVSNYDNHLNKRLDELNTE